MEKVKTLNEQELEEKMYQEIRELIENSRKRVITFVNIEKVMLYWNIIYWITYLLD